MGQIENRKSVSAIGIDISDKMDLNPKEFSEEVTKRALTLFNRKERGHLGEILYQNGGGKKFEDFIKSNPDYYFYKGEINHIHANRRAIAASIADTEHLIVVGQGPASSFEHKEMQIAGLLNNLQSVTAIELNQQFNAEARSVVEEFNNKSGKNIVFESHRIDFRNAASFIPHQPHTTVISTGGLVANIPNAPTDGFPEIEMENTLMAFRNLVGEKGHVIIGYDTNEDYDTLRRAYSQALAPFIVNIAKIIGQHCKGIKNFDPDPSCFGYEMEWIKQARQVAHKLVIAKPQTFQIETPSRTYSRTLDIGDSYTVISTLKPSASIMTRLARNIKVGLETETVYTDRHGLAEHVFSCASTAPLLSISTIKTPRLAQPEPVPT